MAEVTKSTANGVEFVEFAHKGRLYRIWRPGQPTRTTVSTVIATGKDQGANSHMRRGSKLSERILKAWRAQ